MNFRKHLTLRALYEEFWTHTYFPSCCLILWSPSSLYPTSGKICQGQEIRTLNFCSKAEYHKINNVKLNKNRRGNPGGCGLVD